MDESGVLVEVRTELVGSVGRVHVKGRLDCYASVLVAPAVQRLLGTGATAIELYTADVTTADAAGIAAVVEGRRAAVDGGASFALVAPSATVSQAIRCLQRTLREPPPRQ